jgi:hypothetical protein
MDVIEKIKLLRSKSRESTDNLNIKREETIKRIQLQQVKSDGYQ